MGKHTPGPWRVQPSFLQDRTIAREVDGELIAKCFISSEAEANTRLIAAAPEMYEALKEVTSRVENLVALWDEQGIKGITKPRLWNQLENDAEQVRDLIAKIEG